MLFKLVNDVNYSYAFITAPSCAKKLSKIQQVTGTENIVKYLITKLQQKVDLQGRNISFDCLFTSMPLTQWLLSRAGRLKNTS